MTAYTRGMNQTATYWAPGANDGFGGVAFSVAPVAIAVRWQNKIDTIRNAQGEEYQSTAIVYVDRELAQKGYIALGDFTDDVDSDGLSDPRDYEGAREVMMVGQSPSIAADQILFKVWL